MDKYNDVVSVNKIEGKYIACYCSFDLYILELKECIMVNNEHTICLGICYFNVDTYM